MTTSQIGTTEAVFGHHLQAMTTRQLDEVMLDFTEESVVLSQNGVFRGLAEVRAFFEGALNVFTPDVISKLQIANQEVAGDYAYIVWSAAPTILFASDTFYIRDGKIMMQSFVAQFGGQ